MFSSIPVAASEPPWLQRAPAHASESRRRHRESAVDGRPRSPASVCPRRRLPWPAGLAYLHGQATWSHHPQAAKAHGPIRLTSAYFPVFRSAQEGSADGVGTAGRTGSGSASPSTARPGGSGGGRGSRPPSRGRSRIDRGRARGPVPTWRRRMCSTSRSSHARLSMKARLERLPE